MSLCDLGHRMHSIPTGVQCHVYEKSNVFATVVIKWKWREEATPSDAVVTYRVDLLAAFCSWIGCKEATRTTMILPSAVLRCLKNTPIVVDVNPLKEEKIKSSLP